jgi:hypothetical protein
MVDNQTSEPGHGDSLASWTTVIIIMIATAIGTLAFWFNLAVVVWISAGVALAAIPLGIFLKRAGYGVGGEKSQKKS